MDGRGAIQPHIMLMDADRARSTRRCGQLSAQGWLVTTALDELEALQSVRSQSLDLALIDMPLREAADMDLPRVLRQVAPCPYLPVVVLADEPGPADCCRFLDSGADDILPHSIGPAELVARMRALLRIKELQDELEASRSALEQALARERQLLQKLQKDNRQLTEMVVTDPLTRLYNRRYFQKFLDDEFKIARRYSHPLSLLMIDLDHFKMVNDTFGHPAGDFVLKEFSVILRQQVRESDVVARAGGEEFAIILPRADRDQAETFAHRIRLALADHAFVMPQNTIRITCSLGLASYPQDADVTSPNQLLYFADQALLAAKQAGRNCLMHWHTLDATVRSRLRGQYMPVSPTEAPPLDIALR